MSPRDKFLAALERTERMSPAALADYQNGLLARMLLHARREVPAYRHRLDAVFDADGAFRMERWRELPILTRAEIGGDTGPFRLPVVPEALQPVSETWSTGTTGTAISIPRTSLAQLVMACLVERRHRWHGIETRSPLAMIRYVRGDEADYPDGATKRGWSFASPDAELHTLAVRTPVPEQIAWLSRRRPAYLTVYPSVGAEIARQAGGAGRTLGIRHLFSFGETVEPAQREIVQDNLGATIIDTYSASEIGTIAVQCPASDAYHVMAEANYVEILDEDGEPVGPGEVGRIVVTPIYNTAMPLIRYETGDYAVTAEAGPCPCGVTLPRLKRILGRSRHMFRFADGTVRWPNLHMGDLAALLPFRDLQVVQHTQRDLELRIVPAQGPAEGPADGWPGAVNTAAIEALARRDLHPDISLTVTLMERLPRTPGGKFERYVSLVPPGADGLSGRSAG